jgi:mannose-1-phosphate guanylyltransferase/phosphomannomutase
MIQQHRQENTSVTLHTYRHAGINYKSKITFNDTTLLSFTEEATSKTLPDGEAVWSNGSFYIIEPEVLEELQPDIPTDFARDVFPSLIKKGKRLSVFPTSGYFLDIGTLETLKKAEEDLQKGLLL